MMLSQLCQRAGNSFVQGSYYTGVGGGFVFVASMNSPDAYVVTLPLSGTMIGTSIGLGLTGCALRRFGIALPSITHNVRQVAKSFFLPKN